MRRRRGAEQHGLGTGAVRGVFRLQAIEPRHHGVADPALIQAAVLQDFAPNDTFECFMQVMAIVAERHVNRKLG